MPNKKSNKGMIKCGGGLILLGDGTFSFFVELHIEDYVFNFESLDNFHFEAEAEGNMNMCISAFPGIVAKAASEKDFDILDSYCEKWRLVKINPYLDEEDTKADPQGSLH